MLYSFTTDYSGKKIQEIVDYLTGPRLWIPQADYPDFDEWLEKSFQELKSGKKRATIALHYNDVVGVLVYQQHKKADELLELKNLTVRPNHQGRYIASFLLRNTEIEGSKEFESQKIICDTKVENTAIQSFLFKNSYEPQEVKDLYGLEAGKDVVFQKDASKVNRRNRFIYE